MYELEFVYQDGTSLKYACVDSVWAKSDTDVFEMVGDSVLELFHLEPTFVVVCIGAKRCQIPLENLYAVAARRMDD